MHSKENNNSGHVEQNNGLFFLHKTGSNQAGLSQTGLYQTGLRQTHNNCFQKTSLSRLVKKFQKVKFLLVAVLFLLNPVCSFSQIKICAEEEPVINNATPKLKLESPSVVTLDAGDRKDIELTIRNVGAAMAYNNLIQATIDGEAPFTVSFENECNSIAVIAATAKKIIKLHVVVDGNAKAGTYPVTLKHSFTNAENTNFTESDTFNVKVRNKNTSPVITIDNFTNTKTNINPGDQFSLSALIQNNSSHDASELQVSIEGIKTDEINLANSTMATYFESFHGGMQKYLNFDFLVSTKIKSGSYPLNFKVTYKDSDGKSYEKNFYYYVQVGGQSQIYKPQIELSDISSSRTTLKVGQDTNITMKIKNVGEGDAKNVKITATSDSDGGLVPKTSNVIAKRVLKKNTYENLTFEFTATGKAKSQNYPVKFLVEYENGEVVEDKAQVDSFEQYVGINVDNPEAASSDAPQSKPKIIVSSYSTNPIIVTAGSQFDLNLSFKNTHGTKRVENTKVSLTIDEATTSTNEQKGNVFTPVNGSTTFFVGDIAPGNVVNKKLTLYTVPTALPKNYGVVVDFEYEDEKHTEIHSTEKIGINVKQAMKLDTSEINIPTDASVDQPTSISFDFYNTGKVNLNNLLIRIEGDTFDAKQSAVYYGKFNTSTSDTYDGSFTPLEPGQQEGKIIISYEDDAGEIKTEIKDFVVNVKEAMPMEFDQPTETEDFQKPKKSLLKNPFLYVGIAVSVIAAIVIFKKIRHHKKKKGIDLDE